MRPAIWGLPVCGSIEVPGWGTLGDVARPPPDSTTEFDWGQSYHWPARNPCFSCSTCDETRDSRGRFDVPGWLMMGIGGG